MTSAAAEAPQAEQKEKEILLYDAEAKNRFAYQVESEGRQYDVAVIFASLTDERYMHWIREFNLKGNSETLGDNEQSMEATERAYDDIAVLMENIDVEDGEDWKAFVPVSEKVDTFNMLTAVAAFTPEEKADGPRKLRASSEPSRTILTEAHFNGKILQQQHVIREPSIEWKKKYARIQSKRFKQETTRGLRRKPKVEFVPQNERLGELYEEMKISATGFVGSNIPLRFKVQVIEYVFELELTPTEKK